MHVSGGRSLPLPQQQRCTWLAQAAQHHSSSWKQTFYPMGCPRTGSIDIQKEHWTTPTCTLHTHTRTHNNSITDGPSCLQQYLWQLQPFPRPPLPGGRPSHTCIKGEGRGQGKESKYTYFPQVVLSQSAASPTHPTHPLCVGRSKATLRPCCPARMLSR